MAAGEETLSHPNHFSGSYMKAAWIPKSVRCSVSVFVPLHFLERVGKLSSSLFSSRVDGREQQVESAFADKTYISDIDAFVGARRGGLPRSCKTQYQVMFIATVERAIYYHRAWP